MSLVAGIDVGGTAINYTLLDDSGTFLIEGLCEHPALAREGPVVCVRQIAEGLTVALARAGASASDVVAVGLDTPGPASATGVLSAEGSTNFIHAGWAGFDLRGAVEAALGKPVAYLNDGNAAALWGHYVPVGDRADATSVSAAIGTGLGGGIVIGRHVVKGVNGSAGKSGTCWCRTGASPAPRGSARVQLRQVGDLESLCSLTAIEAHALPQLLARDPSHELHREASLHVAASACAGWPSAAMRCAVTCSVQRARPPGCSSTR
jgi:predicted NBD/HSP70 family sugar kinase